MRKDNRVTTLAICLLFFLATTSAARATNGRCKGKVDQCRATAETTARDCSWSDELFTKSFNQCDKLFSDCSRCHLERNDCDGVVVKCRKRNVKTFADVEITDYMDSL